MTPRVWVVTVNFNGLEDTRKCLQSLGGLSHPVGVVVVDNASAVNPIPVLAPEFPRTHFIRNPANGGWSGGNNTGIRHALKAGADWIILLNNDTTVRSDLADKLLAAASTRPGHGILGPVIRYMDEPELVMTDGIGFDRAGRRGFFYQILVPEQSQHPPAVADVDIVNGCCMMVHRDVFERIGLIEDRFFLIHEESDFCLRALRSGFKCGIVAEGLVWHKGSTSFKRSGKRWQRYYDTRNLGLLLSRHPALRGKPGGGLLPYVSYLRYAYHRYCHEREDGQCDSADAVLEGLVDLALRRFGPHRRRQRWPVPVLRFVFESARRLTSTRSVEPPPAARKDLWAERGQA